MKRTQQSAGGGPNLPGAGAKGATSPLNESIIAPVPTPGPRTRDAWRFRQCPGCFTVFAAGELHQVDYGSNWREHGSSRCSCPHCGHRAQRSDFRVVRDARRDGGA